MRTLHLHLGLSLLLLFTFTTAGECSTLDKMVESLWTRLERIWESSLLLKPLSFLKQLRSFQLVSSAVRFVIETFVKLPFNASLKVFDFVCDTLSREGMIGKPGLIGEANLALVLVNDEGSDKIALPALVNITDSPRFTPGVDLVIFIPGWSRKDSGFDATTQKLVEAFNQRYDRVFGVLDLGAALDNLYTWSAYNAREVGNILGLSLFKIADKVPAERIHLIGAGLGAQIAAFAGKKFAGKSSKKIGRITGLDPSRPCFGNAGLDSSAAIFVDVIHSSKLFGTFEAKGHVDFYANRISTTLPSTGCESFFCLHQQAVLYLAEAVIPGQEGNFCGTLCESRNRFEMGHCKDNEEIFMGLSTPKDARGSYYLNTNLRSPYGQCQTPFTEPDESNNKEDGSNTDGSGTKDSGSNDKGGSDKNKDGGSDKNKDGGSDKSNNGGSDKGNDDNSAKDNNDEETAKDPAPSNPENR